MTYIFISNTTGDQVEVEADGFEEASNIMFGDLGDGTEPYDYNEYELDSTEGWPPNTLSTPPPTTGWYGL